MSSHHQKPRERPTKLYIFDFDQTLFRSPSLNKSYYSERIQRMILGCGWYAEPRLLQFPCIPHKPSENWWNGDVVVEAMQAIQDPYAICILLTGRNIKFKKRIQGLCQNCIIHPLYFHDYILKDTDKEHTLDFKKRVIETILNQNPNINQLVMFEDRVHHVTHFRNHFESRISFLIHHIETPEPIERIGLEIENDIVKDLISKQNRILKSERKTPLYIKPVLYYTGIILSEESQRLLRLKFPPPSEFSFKGDHMTVSLGDAKNKFKSTLGKIDSQVTLQAFAFGYIPGKIQAVEVCLPNHPLALISKNDTPHITLSISADTKSRESNDIDNWFAIEPFLLIGKYQVQYKWE